MPDNPEPTHRADARGRRACPPLLQAIGDPDKLRTGLLRLEGYYDLLAREPRRSTPGTRSTSTAWTRLRPSWNG